MIADVADAITTKMKALGYIEASDDEELRERRYSLRFDGVVSDQSQRGTMVANRARVSCVVHARLQYPSSKRQERYRRTIAEAQETVGLALYTLTISNVSQVLIGASVEERPDGIVSDIAVRFQGDISQ